MSDRKIKFELSPNRARELNSVLQYKTVLPTQRLCELVAEAIATHEREEKRGKLGLPWTAVETNSSSPLMEVRCENGPVIETIAGPLVKAKARLIAAAPDLAVLELSDCDECHPLDAMRRERDVYIRMCDETRVERDALREQLANANGDKETALGNWRLALDQRDALREALALRCRQTGCDARCSCCEEKFAALGEEAQPPHQVGIADVVAVQKLGEKLDGEGR